MGRLLWGPEIGNGNIELLHVDKEPDGLPLT